MSRSPTVRWSNNAPRQEGYWWYRDDPDTEAQIVKVYPTPTGWTLTYRDLGADPDDFDAPVDFVENWLREGKAQWCRIIEPRE